MKLIVGLGNPGENYKNTRHNIGFIILDYLAKCKDIKFDKKKFNSEYTITYINNEKNILVKPNTFMNLSGESVRKFMNYYDIKKDDLLVVYDDLDTKLANFKLKNKGRSGGHRGIKNIIENMNSTEFNRLKIGIGRPTNKIDIKDYVLGKFSRIELEELKNIFDKSISCIEDFSKLSFLELMNKYN